MQNSVNISNKILTYVCKLCVTFTGLLCSSSSTTITSTITATQYIPVIRSSANQTLSESCDTATVHTTSSVKIKPSTEINPSRISHSKQGKINYVVYVINTTSTVYCITM